MRFIFLFFIFISGVYSKAIVLSPYTIQGTVATSTADKFLYLYTFPTSLQSSLLISVPVVNGQFKVNGTINQEKGKYTIGRLFFYGRTGLLKSEYTKLSQAGNLRYRDFILESEVNITIDSLIERSGVKGGDLNSEYNQVNEIYAAYSVKSDSLKSTYVAPRQNVRNRDALQQRKISLSYASQLIELQDQRNAQLMKFINENPTSPIALDQLFFLTSLSESQRRKFQQSLEETEPLLPSEWLNTAKGKLALGKIHALKIYHRLRPGVNIPDFVFADEDTSVTVQEFKGNYLLLSFWTSWSAECRAQQVFLKQAYQKFQGNGLKILQVSMDANNQNWKEALKQEGIQWKQARCKSGWDKQVERTFEIYGVPANYLIDQKGKITAVNLMGKELGETLAEVFK